MLPGPTREAMLRGIDANEIIVGAYTDGEGGICPMLAAHRNGGRTDFASFARAWDAYTGAKRPRRATRREIRTRRSYHKTTGAEGFLPTGPLAAVVEDVRRNRRRAAERAAWADPAQPAAPKCRTRPLDVIEATAAQERDVLSTVQRRRSRPVA